MKKKIVVLLAIIILSIITAFVYSHCQIPCGIYDDPMQFKIMKENITTIEKSMTMINKLSEETPNNYNQIVRWVNNKDAHADEFMESITGYFMAQRVIPVEQDKPMIHNQYVRQIAILHKLLITAMKTKQSTDLQLIKDLRDQLDNFEKLYFEKSASDLSPQGPRKEKPRRD